MEKKPPEQNLFDSPSIWKILLKIAPPVMLAQLIQAMYNIVDSYFVGQYSGDGLSALAVIYPVQLIITAIAVGTGVGVNTKMSRDWARGRAQQASRTAGTGLLLAIASWAVFTVLSLLIMRPYVEMSVASPDAVEYAMTYGKIVCIGSLGIFLESMWSKVHQAKGNMKLPMIAQVAGALTNILLDPLLIFGKGPFPALGIAGAAWATVAGQVVAAIITSSGVRMPPPLKLLPIYAKKIYLLGFPNIFMQLLFTVYIVALNIILGSFADEAITVLGLYYKVQSFFFIPLFGLQTCIVPFLSYVHAKGDYRRCRAILNKVCLLSAAFMLAGVLCFELIPQQLLSIFSQDPKVYDIGIPAFRIIGISFFPAVYSLTMPVFFQAIGKGKPSILLSLTRQIFCLIPLFWIFSKISLGAAWAAFPASEIITGGLGLYLLARQNHLWDLELGHQKKRKKRSNITMKLITAVISKKDSDSVCQALTEGGFYFTKMVSSGGFLRSGNTTLLIGTEAEQVKPAISIIREHCSRRTESVSAPIAATAAPGSMSQVVVGGATVFVTAVEEFEKM